MEENMYSDDLKKEINEHCSSKKIMLINAKDENDIIDVLQKINKTKDNSKADLDKLTRAELENCNPVCIDGEELIIPKQRLLKDLASRNYMADLLVSFKQSRPFNKICLFQIVMGISVLILSFKPRFNEQEQTYFDSLLTDNSGITQTCSAPFDNWDKQIYLIILIVVHSI